MPSPSGASRSVTRVAAAGAFFAGLALLGFVMVMLAVAASLAGTTPLVLHDVTVDNGTATLTYPVPAVSRGMRLQGDYAFHGDPGTVVVGWCSDYRRILAGQAPYDPAFWRTSTTSGSFDLTQDDILPRTWHYFPPAPPAPPGDPTRTRELYLCSGAFVLLQWPADQPRPDVALQVREAPLDADAAAPLGLLSLLGGALLLAGGLAWGRARNRDAHLGAAAEDESTAETLLRAVERTGGWIERTRRTVLVSGILGVFLWYPVLLPWAWNVGSRASTSPAAPWIVAGGALLLLLALTALWAREYLRLDRELVAWSERVARLRAREAALLNELEETP